MSLFHRSAQAAEWSPNRPFQPCAAAVRDAATADASGVGEVSAVSTPTNFVSSYEPPDCTSNLTLSLVVSLFALLLALVLVGLTPLPGLSVDATVPAVPRVWVVKLTSIEAGDPDTAPPPVCTSRRAPAPSMASVTVAGPLQCGTIVMWTAPTCGLARSATIS